jgi:topoisomerase-4 subunit A
VVEITFAKDRGKERKPNQMIDVEQFIDVKGISAQGNQLSRLKVNQIDLSEPLPYEAPEEVHADELEVVDEEVITTNTAIDVSDEISSTTNSAENSEITTLTENKEDSAGDPEGQITLF